MYLDANRPTELEESEIERYHPTHILPTQFDCHAFETLQILIASDIVYPNWAKAKPSKKKFVVNSKKQLLYTKAYLL